MLGERERAMGLAAQALAIYEAIESPHVGMVRGTLALWRGDAADAAEAEGR